MKNGVSDVVSACRTVGKRDCIKREKRPLSNGPAITAATVWQSVPPRRFPYRSMIWRGWKRIKGFVHRISGKLSSRGKNSAEASAATRIHGSSREVLEQIIEAGRYTATAKNAQACTLCGSTDTPPEFKDCSGPRISLHSGILRETKPDYVRAFTRFYEKWKKDPQG